MTCATSAPSESRFARTDSSTGSAEAKTSASAIRRSSGDGVGAKRSKRRATFSWAALFIACSCRAIARSRGLVLAFGIGRAHPDRREGRLLAKLDLALADEFERSGEAGG